MVRVAYQFVPPPMGGFHLGREGLALEETADSFPSDSLVAAMIAVAFQVYPAHEAQTFVDWLKDGHLRVSSVFPYVASLPLFPLPRMRVELGERGDPKTAKKLKKLAYVSSGILALLLQGTAMNAWLPTDDNPAPKGQIINRGKVWLTNKEAATLDADLLHEKLWDTGQVPRVTVDRRNSSTAIYQVGRTVFRPGCGLWMMADVADELHPMLETLLHALSDSGIGGERSSGYGQFTLKAMPVPPLPTPDTTQRGMLLSRYSPQYDELSAGVLQGDSSYDLVDVGGWFYSPQHASHRRARVRMLEVGSVISTANGVPMGQLVDVNQESKPHPVYRGGLAMMIGVSAKGGR